MIVREDVCTVGFCGNPIQNVNAVNRVIVVCEKEKDIFVRQVKFREGEGIFPFFFSLCVIGSDSVGLDSIRDGPHRMLGDVCIYVYVYVLYVGTPTSRWKCECVVEMNLIHTEDESSSACVMNLFSVLGFYVYMYRVDLILVNKHSAGDRRYARNV